MSTCKITRVIEEAYNVMPIQTLLHARHFIPHTPHLLINYNKVKNVSKMQI